MTQIKQLVGMMRDELQDAEKYAQCALNYKTSDKELADMFAMLSKQELEHSALQHAQAVRLIKSYGKEPPEAMRAVWEWQHEQMTAEETEVRVMLNMYHGK